MTRAFLDANILFAAGLSPKGGARRVLIGGLHDQWALVVSALVVEEAGRNLSKKAPQAVATLELLLEVLPLAYAAPTKAQVKAAAAYTAAKDAPVVAAAQAGGCAYLVTHDKKHLSGAPDVAEHAGVRIVSPGQFLTAMKGGEDA